MAKPEIDVRKCAKAPRTDCDSGLLGYLSVTYGDLILDGITVRRTTAGRLALSFPERRDSKGRRHPFIRPVDSDARRRLERLVFDETTLVKEMEW